MPNPESLAFTMIPTHRSDSGRPAGRMNPAASDKGAPMKRCLKKAALGVSILALAGGALIWRESRADALLTRIHHGMLVCASGDAATATLESQIAAPPPVPLLSALHPDALSVPKADQPDVDHHAYSAPMVRLVVSSDTDGRLVVGSGTTLLSDALKATHDHRKLVMLTLHDVAPNRVTQAIRTAGMRHRVIVAASNDTEAHSAMNADKGIMIALPVRTEREEVHARRLAGAHPYAAYLPSDAAPDLFAAAHRDADAVIADGPLKPDDPSKLQALLDEPVDIIVTDQPVRFAATMSGDEVGSR